VAPDEHKKISLRRAAFLFLTRRKAFLELCVRHDRSYLLAESPDLLEKYRAGSYTPDEAALRKGAADRAVHIAASLRSAAIVVGVTALVGAGAGYTLGRLLGNMLWLIQLAQFAGAALILWATIWELGWNVRSFGGDTLPERVHQYLFRVLYAVGTFLFILAYFWPGGAGA
jgi:hypothetical protein